MERRIKMTSHSPMEKWLKIAGVFVLVGLLVEMAALRWVHPSAFLVFAFVGVPVALLGTAIYLYSLVSQRERDE